MTVTVERVEKELNVPRDLLLRDGMKRYLEFELRRLEIEATKIRRKIVLNPLMIFGANLKVGKYLRRNVLMISPA